MKQIGTRVQKVSLGVIAAIFVASFFTSIVPAQSVFAVPADDSSTNPDDWLPTTRAKRWALMTGLYSCLEEAWSGANEWEDGFSNDKITQNKASSGKWFIDPLKNDPSEPAGFLEVGLRDGERGMAYCNDIATPAASAYSLTPIELLCNMGASRDDNSPCVDSATGDRFSPPDSGDRMDMTAYWGSKDLPQNAGGTAYYSLNYAALMSNEGCNLKADNGATGDFAYTLKTVDSTGKIVEKTYTGQSRDHKIKVYSSYPGLNDQERSCATIASDLEKYIADYAKWVLGHQESPTNNANDGTGVADETSCAVDGIGWIICPVMSFVGRMNDAAFNFLQSMLGIRPAVITSESTQAAWAAFRDIANVAFVIAFMVIVYSQITSAGISNYGIKKMLPRIVIAAILVNASFIICAIAVDISNIVGSSIYTLLKDSIANNLNGEIATTDWEEKMGGILSGAATALGVILLVVALFMAPAVLIAFALIILILVARQALVVLLIVIAPLAFVAYLLPNTEDWFKKWQKAFVTVLMVYPIVGLVFGASTLASRVLMSVGQNEDEKLMQLIALGVLAVPLFAVPAILKGSLSAAGSIGTKIAGLADKSTRMSSKQLGDRAGGIKKDLGNRFNMAANDPENKLGRRLGGYSRLKARREMGKRDRETAANRSAELGYATSMIEKGADGEFTNRAIRMQKAAAGGVGVANEKGQVRAEALATQRTFKQFDDDVSAFKTTQTNDTHEKLLQKSGNAALSLEERSAAAGSIAGRSFRAGHNEVLEQSYNQMKAADTELRTAESSGDQARIAKAQEQVGVASAIQKQLIGDLKEKPFALGDRAMGQLGEGKFGRAVEKVDEQGKPVLDASGQKTYDAPLLSPREELRHRVETKLNAQTVATLNPDDLKLIHSDAMDGSLNDDQMKNLVKQIAAARANNDTAVLIKPEASDKFDEIISKATERGLTPDPTTAPPTQARNHEANSGSIISGGPDGLN